MKIPAQYTKCNIATCECGKNRFYAFIDIRRMIAFRACRYCGGRGVEAVMPFASKEYSNVNHPCRVRLSVTTSAVYGKDLPKEPRR